MKNTGLKKMLLRYAAGKNPKFISNNQSEFPHSFSYIKESG